MTQAPPMQSITATQPGCIWGVDVFGPLPTSRSGNRYIVVMVDHFTRWVEAVPTVDQTGETVARVFSENVVSRFGVPEKVVTDQGPCFESRKFQEMIQLWGIRRMRTSPYHPQANGITERFNRRLKDWIGGHTTDWEENLHQVLFHYRITKHSSTQVPPFELVYGREPKARLDAYIAGPTKQFSDGERNQLERTARYSTDKVHKRNKRRYDIANRTISWKDYKPGELVRTRNHRRPDVTGP
jgi:transposase InsO family protein